MLGSRLRLSLCCSRCNWVSLGAQASRACTLRWYAQCPAGTELLIQGRPTNLPATDAVFHGPVGNAPSERTNCAAVTWGDYWYIHGGYDVRYGASGELEQGRPKTSM